MKAEMIEWKKPCRCGSGRQARKCCGHSPRSGVKTVGKSGAFRYGAITPTFREIFPGFANSPAHLRAAFGLFNPDEMIEGIARLNHRTSYAAGADDPAEMAAVEAVAGPELTRRLREFAQDKACRLFSPLTYLARIIETLRCPANSNGQSPLSSGPVFVGTLLRMADHAEADAAAAMESSGANFRRFGFGSLLRNIRFNTREKFEYLMGRTYSMYVDHLPRVLKSGKGSIDLAAELANRTGADLKTFLVCMFSTWGYYFGGEEKHGQFLKQLDQSPPAFYLTQVVNNFKPAYQSAAASALRLLTGDMSSLADEVSRLEGLGDPINRYAGLDILWRRPLYKTPQGCWFPVDRHLLEERMTSGIKWAIHDAVVADAKAVKGTPEEKRLLNLRGDVMALFGHVLDSYVSDIVDRIWGERHSVTVLRDAEVGGGADFSILDSATPHDAVVIETTASGIRVATAMSGDMDLIDEEVDREIFFKTVGKEKRGKMAQLDWTVSQLRAGTLKGQGAQRPKRIYPILVLENGLPTSMGLLDHFRDRVRAKGLLQQDVDRLTIISVSELERLEPILGRPGTSLASVLEEKSRSSASSDSMRNYLHFSGRDEFNEVLQRQWDRLEDDAEEVLIK
ncbi:MAG: hypothetical protein IT452_07770 [Planctomycetia bacterium]|nr:hypothetical protein [Planctomycetia bacterium]